MNSNYWINHIMSETFPSSNATGFYLGLSSTRPNANGGNVTEPSGADYARVQVTAFTSPSNGTVKNKNEISFARAESIWFPPSARAQYWALFDGAGAGAHLLCAGSIAVPLVVSTNATVIFSAESISMKLMDAGG